MASNMGCLWGLFVILLWTLGVRGKDASSLISKSMFEDLLKHRNDPLCPAKGFYTYEAFIHAARSFGAFATSGNPHTRKREIAAFFAQTSHETTGNIDRFITNKHVESPPRNILRLGDTVLCGTQSKDIELEFSEESQEMVCKFCTQFCSTRWNLSHMFFCTQGGGPSLPDGPYAWGYCFKEEQNPTDYCVADPDWPCVPNKNYHGRGPIQISYNFNYGPAGKAIGSDLLRSPNLVARDPTISFKTALWFWMTPQSLKPSSHDVITGAWKPSAADSAAGRVPGYGVVTNIINGGIECGKGSNAGGEGRIGFYKRYCSILGVSPGENLDCYNQRPFGA